MTPGIQAISEEQARIVEQLGEGQFSDVKAKDISPAKLSNTISAFANTDGGELMIGISEQQHAGGVKKRVWLGFPDVEAANGHLQSFENLFPLGNDFQYSFLSAPGRSGFVLKVQVSRTQAVMKARDGLPYVRRAAQNLPLNTADLQKRLEYAKGVASFESETVNVDKALIVDSPITAEFMKFVVPTADPESWLKKQNLIRNDKPTVAGLLLFSEEPQAIIPKHCGVKIYRYKTNASQGFRDALDGTPKTVEGNIYNQIKAAVQLTVDITEGIPKIGSSSFEKIKYPPETLHEIITNAVIHRDYSIADDVHIRIFDNRIEIQSPGRLPAHITVSNFLKERFARNGAVVRLLNKFPDPPNQDVGEGLNTAFEKMTQLGLKEPQLSELDNDVLFVIRHEELASPEETIMKYLESNPTIKNKQARAITHISADYQIKTIFGRMEAAGMIEQVPNTRTSSTAYRKKQDGEA